MDTIGVAVIGCGIRGLTLLKHIEAEEGIRIAVLCDASEDKLRRGLERVGGIEYGTMVTDYRVAVAQPDVDAVFVTVPDFMHEEVAVSALEAGKHTYLEKPIAPTLDAAARIVEAARASSAVLSIGYTLREAPMYQKVIELVRSGTIGQVMHINAWEHLQKDHGASYMRRWHRYERNSGGFLLAKCSHDLDLINLVAEGLPARVASFGGRDYFNPFGDTPARCSECPPEIKSACLFEYTGFGVVDADSDETAHDLCAYNSHKDVVDNQAVMLEYPSGIRASFSMQLFATRGERVMHVTGSKGHIHANLEAGTIAVSSIATGTEQMLTDFPADSFHGGGDTRIVSRFFDAVRKGQAPAANYADGFNSAVVALMAEKSRKTGSVQQISSDVYVATGGNKADSTGGVKQG